MILRKIAYWYGKLLYEDEKRYLKIICVRQLHIIEKYDCINITDNICVLLY